MPETTQVIKCNVCSKWRPKEEDDCGCQDEIQEDTTSMEEKLEKLEKLNKKIARLEEIQEEIDEIAGVNLSLCCGAGTYGEYKVCEACGEHC